MVVNLDIFPPRYRDAEQIGRGGMGDIYRTTDTMLGRTVAIKILADRYAEDEAVRERFTREALAAARLSGEPNTVTIYDVGEHNERPYIVMEYLSGGSLDDVLRKDGAQPPERAFDWLEQAARALDAAHAKGVVHRDVKPGNLMLDHDGSVHVADFGIASAAGMDSLTMTGTVLGTAGYLAPEQARGERATPASDRYALAVLAWEVLTGRRPFEADSPTAEAAAHVNAPVPSVSGVGDLPRQLDPVFDRALAKEPEQRFHTAAEFVAALRAAFANAAGATSVFAPTPAPLPPVARSRAAWPLLAVLLVAGAIAGGVLAYFLTRGDDETVAPPTAIVTQFRTVTTQGEVRTVERAVTVTAAAPTTSASPPPSPPSGQSGSALNDAGFAKMRAGDYSGALPLLEQAVQRLQGTGSIAEAYASYNLAFTRFALGNCNGVVALLDRSESIQGQRVEIDRLREQAEDRC